MDFDLKGLEEPITRILCAPGIDLETISAKRVRSQLVEDASLGLTAEGLKARRSEVDRLIANIYERVSQTTNDSKRRRDDEEGDDVNGEGATSGGDAEKPKPPKKKGKWALEKSDAQLARKLSSEINSRSRRSANSPKKVKRKVKSSETVESGGEDKEPRKKRGGGAKGGFAKEYALSEPLSKVVGTERLSRPQVVKKLWEYIHGNDLQNPSNKKEIVCDGALRAVFMVDKIDMFRMNKVLGQHLHEE